MGRPLPSLNEYACSHDAAIIEHRTNRVTQLRLRGVNLGGWMVIQPWITPSLFYQFENVDKEHVAMDMHGFCSVLPKAEANRQLRQHWSKWLTDADLEALVAQGIDSVRIPVGDWMWLPYEPYIGCTDGAFEELLRVLHACHRLGLRALIDLHAVRRSQNGFDNSGHSLNVTWTSDDHFSHWPTRSAGWQGSFDPATMTYSDISWDNIRATVQVLERIATSLSSLPAVIGVEALNEPWQYTPLDVLRAFYWESYWAVRAAAEHWLFVIHDSFRFDEWEGFMRGCAGVALDTHVYQAWFDIQSQQSFLDNACSWRGRIQAMQLTSLPVLIGEWSLATDNCNMWLNGFHDNAPGFPKVECGNMECPQPLVSGIAGPPTGDTLGPFGTGSSAPSHGRCPISKPWDNEDEYEVRLAEHKISAFEEGVGWFYQNFKVELQPHWSWAASHQRGWLPTNVSVLPERLLSACAVERPGRSIDRSAASDLPWYNALPSPRSSSAMVVLFCAGIGSIVSIAIFLKVGLALLSRSTLRHQVPSDKLQLPPRLLNLARKSHRRKPGGLGPLGLKQRVPSRSLSLSSFPLMHAIAEMDEEADGGTGGRGRAVRGGAGGAGAAPPSAAAGGHVAEASSAGMPHLLSFLPAWTSDVLGSSPPDRADRGP